ncbi:MAG: glycine dehydrogenase (aminomethyl-transferring), partial [Ignavibacteria bacterium]|nr:glycine dehydrogenase (aminomethyl-transferring) [Ignavibacteria bacterium]
MITNNFVRRHIGPTEKDIKVMLAEIGVDSLSQLIYETLPDSIKLPEKLNLGKGMNEFEYIQHLKELGNKNKLYKTFIGMGYYNTITPGVITRNVLENAGWYTAYTPYQAEISQGRLEALLNFQTMVCDMTAMPIANASLLDEATAAAEAMIMFYNARTRNQVKGNINKFLVSDGVFPHTLDVIKTRALPLDIEVVVESLNDSVPADTYFGVLLQYPDQLGQIHENAALVQSLKAKEIQIVVAADILSLALIVPPGKWGADAVVGSTQRFGIPMGFGGPHAAYFATTETYKRIIP